jgi:hypothetical protein
MSDIGIYFGPLDLAVIALIFGSPGLVIGGLAGALAWRGHRLWGCALGALAGCALWLGGWYCLKEVI